MWLVGVGVWAGLRYLHAMAYIVVRGQSGYLSSPSPCLQPGLIVHNCAHQTGCSLNLQRFSCFHVLPPIWALKSTKSCSSESDFLFKISHSLLPNHSFPSLHYSKFLPTSPPSLSPRTTLPLFSPTKKAGHLGMSTNTA